MDGQNTKRYEDWVAEEWAAEDPERDHDATPHWNKFEWVGDQGQGTRTTFPSRSQMPEGERGMSGFRHVVAPAHWAPAH